MSLLIAGWRPAAKRSDARRRHHGELRYRASISSLSSQAAARVGRLFRGPSRRRARRSASSRSVATACRRRSSIRPSPLRAISSASRRRSSDRSRPPKSASARGYHAPLTKNLAKTLGYDNPPDLREQFYVGPLVSRAAEFAHIPGASELYAENIWPLGASGLPRGLQRLLHGAGEPRRHADAHIRSGVGSR